MVGLFSLLHTIERRTCLRFTIDHVTAAAAAEFGKTKKEISMHKCASTWL